MVDEETVAEEQFQFRLSSLFWITTALAIVMAYARSFGPAELWMAFADFGFVVVMVGLIGSLCRSWSDSAFWSVLVTLTAFIAVAGHPLPNPAVGLGWGLVGAGCGALSGARCPRQLSWGVLASALMAMTSMCSVVLASNSSLGDLMTLFDVASAGIVGGLTRLFIELIQTLIQRSQISRYVLGAWIISCVVIGRAAVPSVVAWIVPKLFGD